MDVTLKNYVHFQMAPHGSVCIKDFTALKTFVFRHGKKEKVIYAQDVDSSVNYIIGDL